MYDYGSYTTTQTVDTGTAAALAGFGIVTWLICLAIGVACLVAMWKIFTKAGKEGWKCLIPFYNTYLLFEIAGMNGWMFLIMFIPFVGSLIALILLSGGLAKSFGQSTGFAVGLFFFQPIFLMILGFGSAQYQGVSVSASQVGNIPNQTVNQPMDQSMNQQMNQPMDQNMNQQMNQPMDQNMNQQMNQPEQMTNDQNQNQNF